MSREEDLRVRLSKDGKVLDLEEMGLKEVPDFIKDLEGLTELYLAENKLRSLPEWIGDLKNLEFLDLSYNSLTTLPDSIVHLEKLIGLDLGHNRLESLPAFIGNMSMLGRLHLEHNRLKAFPISMGSLKNLRSLNFEDNYIESLPESMSKESLENLRYINITNNYMEVLPSSMDDFWGLQVDYGLPKKKKRYSSINDKLKIINLMEGLVDANMIKDLKEDMDKYNNDLKSILFSPDSIKASEQYAIVFIKGKKDKEINIRSRQKDRWEKLGEIINRKYGFEKEISDRDWIYINFKKNFIEKRRVYSHVYIENLKNNRGIDYVEDIPSILKSRKFSSKTFYFKNS